MIFFGLLFCVPVWLAGQSQPYILRSQFLSRNDGLLGVYNHSIIQDSYGFLWVGSSEGLTRYDGYRFKTFTSFRNGLSDVDVKAIGEVADGRIAMVYNKHYRFFDLFDPHDFAVQRIDLTAANGLRGQVINFFFEKKGGIYFLSLDGGQYTLWRFDGRQSFQELFSLPVGQSAQISNPAVFLRDYRGGFWLGGELLGLMHTDSSGQVLHHYAPGQLPGNGAGNPIILYQDRYHRLWLSLAGVPGIFTFKPSEDRFIPHASLPPDAYYDTVWEDQSGNLLFKCGAQRWYSEASSLYCLGRDGHWEDFSILIEFNRYVLAAFGHDFFRGVLLSAGSGIHKIVLNTHPVETHLARQLQPGDWGVSIRGIAPDGAGGVYIIREVNAWYRFDLAKDRLDTIPLVKTIDGDSIFWRQGGGILVDNRFVWSSGNIDRGRYGLLRMDRHSQELKAFFYPQPIEDFIPGSDGRFWLGCSGQPGSELVIFDPETGVFESYRDKDGNNPLDELQPIRLFWDKNGLLWVGAASGLVRVDTRRQTSHRYSPEELIAAGFTGNHINAFFEDEDGRLWLGTDGGVNVFDPEKEKVIDVYDRSTGLVGNDVNDILIDDKKNFWITTGSGLSYFDTRHRRFRNFTMWEGLAFEEINRRTLYQDSLGRVFVGGLNGIMVLRPEKILKERVYPPPIVTGIAYYDSRRDTLVVPGQGQYSRQSLTLPPYIAYFECHFSLPSYDESNWHQYSAWLEGYDSNWNFLGNQSTVRYNYLPAGDYRLHIRASDANGNPSRKDLVLDIHVREVYYRTLWFKALITGVFGLLVLWFYRFLLDRRIALQRAEQLRELDILKSRLFANIAHELRTPLTLILGLSKRLFAAKLDPERNKMVEIIRRNGEQILRLVNQMLDLRKLEAGKLEPDLIQGDVMAFIVCQCENFSSLAETRGINLLYEADPRSLVMDYDPDMLGKIISNLCSNAIKFTPPGGRVALHAFGEEDNLLIRVSDTGPGIAPQDLDRIFEPFFQSTHNPSLPGEGSGIGLTLTRELVQLLGGRIEVGSNPGGGSVFSVRLPVLNRAPFSIEPSAADGVPGMAADALPAQKREGDSAGKESPVILVVEDNQSLASYIGSCLQPGFSVHFAPDGEAGIEQAVNLIPDIIISDVMMPKMDGFELCQTLKADERTSHIPLILLTARTEIEDRLEGLRRGADAYLAKPFEEEELFLLIQNLRAQRSRFHRRFAAETTVLPPASQPRVPMDSPGTFPNGPDLEIEAAFMKKVLAEINGHIGDHDFTVAALCQSLAMSKSQLHRKLTALTGKSANRLIRSVRLEKACRLLQASDLNISEIAFQTGFNDPAYFSRLFSQELGMSPSDFREGGDDEKNAGHARKG